MIWKLHSAHERTRSSFVAFLLLFLKSNGNDKCCQGSSEPLWAEQPSGSYGFWLRRHGSRTCLKSHFPTMHHAGVSAAGEMISAASPSGEMLLCRATQRFSRRAKVLLSLLPCFALVCSGPLFSSPLFSESMPNTFSLSLSLSSWTRCRASKPEAAFL